MNQQFTARSNGFSALISSLINATHSLFSEKKAIQYNQFQHSHQGADPIPSDARRQPQSNLNSPLTTIPRENLFATIHPWMLQAPLSAKTSRAQPSPHYKRKTRFYDRPCNCPADFDNDLSNSTMRRPSVYSASMPMTISPKPTSPLRSYSTPSAPCLSVSI